LTFALPVLAGAIVPFILWIGRAFGLGRRAHWPALLYVFTAPVVLITHQLDQSLYPLCAVCAWAPAVAARRSTQPLLWAALSGVLGWIALFVSFSLLPALLLLPIFFAAAHGSREPHDLFRQTARTCVAAAAAFGCAEIVAHLALGYDTFDRLRAALAHHRNWIGVSWNALATLRYGAMTLLEFFYWLGPPLTILFGSQALKTARPSGQPHGAGGIIAFGAMMSLLATALLGTTARETARLWIFFVVPIVLAIPDAIETIEARRAPLVFQATLVASAAWTALLKAKQDWY
jgi:hypothetical protein